MIRTGLLILAATDPLDPPEIGAPVKVVVLGIVGLLTVGVLVLTFAKLWMDVLGKRPGNTITIQAHSEQQEHKETSNPPKAVFDLAGFVASKDFEAHKEEFRLRTLGLEKQISDARHDWSGQLQAYVETSSDREERTEKAIDTMNTKANQNGERLAGVETKADLILAMLQNLDNKVHTGRTARQT